MEATPHSKLQENLHARQRLPRDFYLRDTITVAEELLGKVLVYQATPALFLAGRIIETEAYLGLEDPAAHTYGGRRTARNASMYLEGGHAYVYQIYGLHLCLNVVTKEQGTPEAVLLRALEPFYGLEHMLLNRGGTCNVANLTSGPGRLCQALGFERSLDGTDFVTSPKIFIAHPPNDNHPSFTIERGERVGIDYAGDAAIWPLRFAVKGHPCISRPFKQLPTVALALQP